MILDERWERMSTEELRQLQIERLQSILNRAYRNVSFYKQLFDEHCINLETIKSLDAVKTLPFTTKEDLRKSYPYDMFAVPLRDIVRIHSTTGTTGQPIIVGYTRNDLRHWTQCTARMLAAAGVSEHDVVQIAYPYTLFTGGFGFHQGAELIGASVIPSSSTTSPEKQIDIMRDFKTTALLSTPSYALNLAAVLEEKKIHPETLQLKVGLFGAEPWTEALRGQIEEKLHISAIDNYGLTEIMGPGVAGECTEKNGLHVNEDHFIVEVIDPETGGVLPPGEKGELVFTTITKEGFPLIRYRTGDISAIIEGPCPCGRTFCRIRKVTGRSDTLIFFEGTSFFPSQIERILLEIEGTSPHYQILLERRLNIDTMEIRVEISSEIPSIDEMKTLEQLRNRILKRIKYDLNIEPKLTFVEPKSINPETGARAPRVVDHRK